MSSQSYIAWLVMMVGQLTYLWSGRISTNIFARSVLMVLTSKSQTTRSQKYYVKGADRRSALMLSCVVELRLTVPDLDMFMLSATSHRYARCVIRVEKIGGTGSSYACTHGADEGSNINHRVQALCIGVFYVGGRTWDCVFGVTYCTARCRALWVAKCRRTHDSPNFCAASVHLSDGRTSGLNPCGSFDNTWSVALTIRFIRSTTLPPYWLTYSWIICTERAQSKHPHRPSTSLVPMPWSNIPHSLTILLSQK